MNLCSIQYCRGVQTLTVTIIYFLIKCLQVFLDMLDQVQPTDKFLSGLLFILCKEIYSKVVAWVTYKR